MGPLSGFDRGAARAAHDDGGLRLFVNGNLNSPLTDWCDLDATKAYRVIRPHVDVLCIVIDSMSIDLGPWTGLEWSNWASIHDRSSAGGSSHAIINRLKYAS